MQPDRLLKTENVPDLPLARKWMCDRLNALGISDHVLKVMGDLPRHAFVPPAYRRLAYSDLDLWLDDSFLPSPQITARIAGFLDGTTSKSVLELVTGTGYGTSVLASLGCTVHTVDHSLVHLHHSSNALLALGLNDVFQRIGSPLDGWAEVGPFDAIIVNASFTNIPIQLMEQLRPETGVLIVPVGPLAGPQRLLAVKKVPGAPQVIDLGQVVFPEALLWTRQSAAWSAVLSGAPIIEAEAFRVPIIEAETLRVPIIEAETLRVPIIEAEALRVPIIEAETLGVPIIEAEAPRVPIIEAETLRVPIVEAEAVGAPVIEAETDRVPIIEAEAVGVPIIEAQTIDTPVSQNSVSTSGINQSESKADDCITLVAVGNMKLGGLPGQAIERCLDPFLPTASLLLADVTIGNLASAILTARTPVDETSTSCASPGVLQILKRYFLAISVANEHSGKFGSAVFAEMERHLRAAELPFFGGSDNSEAARTPLIVERKNIRVAFLGYNDLGPLSYAAEAQTPGVAVSADSKLVLENIKSCRDRKLADLIVIFMNWGDEYSLIPIPHQVELGHALIDAGADLVVGCHPQVVEPPEVYKGKMIFYSLGNYISDGVNGLTAVGVVLRIAGSKAGFHHWNVSNVWLDPCGFPR